MPEPFTPAQLAAIRDIVRQELDARDVAHTALAELVTRVRATRPTTPAHQTAPVTHSADTSPERPASR